MSEIPAAVSLSIAARGVAEPKTPRPLVIVNVWLNVSGHRLGTAEIESALVAHPSVAEAACVGMPHELKGQGIAAFVTLKSGQRPTDQLKKELIDGVARAIGSLAKPDQIRFTDALPKTRSGKIMRRLLKELASGGEVKGDTTTLEDFSVLAKLKESDEG
jgi:acetyl-CoA synthetase